MTAPGNLAWGSLGAPGSAASFELFCLLSWTVRRATCLVHGTHFLAPGDLVSMLLETWYMRRHLER